MSSSTPLDLDRTWTYGPDVQHGGRLLELVVQAALGEVTHADPLAVSAHFLAAPRLGTAEVRSDVLRQGRSVSTVHAQLVQGDRVCTDVTVTAGDLGAWQEPVASTGRPPVLPPVQDCVSSRGDDSPRNGISEQLDLRIDPATAAWLDGGASGAEIRGWVRYTSGREVDPLALLCLADALPPVTFSLGIAGWAPTVELTVHVRARPQPGWLRVVQRATVVAGGWFDETCEIWDSADRLVAQAVQLAGYRAA